MDLAENFWALRAERDRLEAELKELKERLAIAETELLTWMQNRALDSVRDERGTLYIKTECYASIGDPDTAFAWLRQNNMADVIRTTVNAKTLSGIVKDFGGEVPGVHAKLEAKIGYRRKNQGER